ncbi:uncharacterized protein LOC124451218 isoform X2 [Xenia sp. Carnegie-2017]|uniref:uncharacterized protein LOC124451218 isoform X2 n=1 Tax=Xenia sp. Carnegie-2017 TaxID=2897299 RepID=UPI001F048816|nr:uncharacterized protein LOC124451218 isoform X2 [Xenia sp. Carnegie-2017]
MVRTSKTSLKNVVMRRIPMEWTFNRLGSEVLMTVSFIFLIFMLLSTYILMNRIAKLEHRYHLAHDPEGINKNLLPSPQWDDNWTKLLKEQEKSFQDKRKRFHEELSGLILSVNHMQSTLEIIKEEFSSPNDRNQIDSNHP